MEAAFPFHPIDGSKHPEILSHVCRRARALPTRGDRQRTDCAEIIEALCLTLNISTEGLLPPRTKKRSRRRPPVSRANLCSLKKAVHQYQAGGSLMELASHLQAIHSHG